MFGRKKRNQADNIDQLLKNLRKNFKIGRKQAKQIKKTLTNKNKKGK